MRISEMMMSNSLDSRRLRSNSQLVAISTRCPSLRKVISRSSQMERSSSTIRILAISSHPGQFDGELRPVIFLRYHCDAPAVRVHDLINDRQSQTRSADKAGLQRLEYFHALSGIDSHSSIAKANADPKRRCLQLHHQGGAGRHGPEHLSAHILQHLLYPLPIP